MVNATGKATHRDRFINLANRYIQTEIAAEMQLRRARRLGNESYYPPEFVSNEVERW